jgi:hypothetical protein
MKQDFNDIHRLHHADAAREAFDVGFENAHGHERPWWRDPATIPARQFLYGRHYIRRAIGATIAAGGRGKTTLSVLEAVTMAGGFHFTTRESLPGGPLRVWLINGEEEQDELDRRVAGVCQHYRISEADLGGRLYAQSVRDRPMRLVVMDRGQPAINTAVIEQMIDFIKRNKIDVFMADPLVSFHDVPENDNSAMDKVIKQGFGAVSGRTNSAGEVFHQPGKPKQGQTETVVEDGRGASAILWAVRSARVLNFMTPGDAERLGMSDEERKLHIRIANGKANMAPLGKSKWMKMVVEPLPNGDQVAVGTWWKPPDPFQDVTPAHRELAAKLAATGEYRADRRSPKWFGYALAEHLGLDVSHSGSNSPQDIAKLKAIIGTWQKNKVFEVKKKPDADGKKRDFIVPGTCQPAARTGHQADDYEGDIE